MTKECSQPTLQGLCNSEHHPSSPHNASAPERLVVCTLQILSQLSVRKCLNYRLDTGRNSKAVLSN